MRSQLYRLAEVAEHPRTTIQVIRSGGAHAGLLGGFIIADLDRPAMTGIAWRTSNYSGSNGGACIEVGTTGPAIAVRDGKDQRGPQLAFPANTWQAFTSR